jgi:hypothetical protein
MSAFTAPSPDPKMSKIEDELVEVLVGVLYPLLKKHDRQWDVTSPAARPLHSIEQCAERASEILCKGIVVPTFTVEKDGPNAPMLRRNAECQARRRFDLVLFAPV